MALLDKEQFHFKDHLKLGENYSYSVITHQLDIFLYLFRLCYYTIQLDHLFNIFNVLVIWVNETMDNPASTGLL